MKKGAEGSLRCDASGPMPSLRTRPGFPRGTDQAASLRCPWGEERGYFHFKNYFEKSTRQMKKI